MSGNCNLGTPADDVGGEMRRNPLDDRTADRLLSGAVTSEDAPSGYAGVAALLQQARTGSAGGVLARDATTVAAMSSVVLAHPVPVSTPRGKTMLTKILTAKVAAAAAVGLLSATGAAAATNTLPTSAQSTVSDVLSNVGISVPSPNASSAGHADKSGNTSKASTETPNDHADYGLCTAANASDGHANPNSAVPSSTSTTCPPRPGKPANAPSQGTANKPVDAPSQGTANKPASAPSGQPSTNSDTKPAPASGTAPVTTPNNGAGAPQSSGNSSTGAPAASSGSSTAPSHPGRP
ncbi:MAG: hypothetical protein NVS3B21_23610 [Acidimicrobiales bacterium]